MADLVIDLRAKVVAADARVWRVFPGNGYAFLDAFQNRSKVFMDLPNLELPAGEVTEQMPLLPERVRRSLATIVWTKAMRKWEAADDDSKSPPTKPPTELDQYKTEGQFGSGNVEINRLVSMFGVAKKGDLIVVPDRPKKRTVYIGEFATDAEERTHINLESHRGSGVTPARNVNWISEVDEVRLDRTLSMSLRHQRPISELDSSYIRKILDLSFGTYVYGRETKAARLYSGASEFSEQNNLDFSIALKLAAQLGWDFLYSDISAQSFSRYLIDILPPEGSVSLSSNLNSPGFLNAKGFTLGPLLLAALLCLGADCNLSSTEIASTLQVVNSTSTEDTLVTDSMREAIKASMVNIGFEEWEEFKARSKRLRDDARIEASPRIVQSP